MKRRNHRTVTAIIMGLMSVVGCESNGTTFTLAGNENEDIEMINDLFQNVVKSEGQEYVQARDELLARGEQAVAWLQAVGEDPQTPLEQAWLAEILVERAEHREAFEEGEQAFHKRVVRAYTEIPEGVRMPPHSRTPGPPPMVSLPLPGQEDLPLGEQMTSDEREQSNYETLSERLSEQDYERRLDFIEKLRLPESKHWPSILGEVALKGHIELEPDEQHNLGAGAAEGSPLNALPVLQAALLLVKLDEPRAYIPLQQIITERERTRGGRVRRMVAIRSLGILEHRGSVDLLLEVAQEEQEDRDNRRHAVNALGQIGDPRVLPVLKDLAEHPRSLQTVEGRLSIAACDAIERIEATVAPE